MSTLALERNSGIYDGLDQYMTEVKRVPLLKREEEHALAMRLHDEGDVDAAHRLVTANLRFVVKVAFEYKAYGLRLLDLVQEGNIGLMHAVRKFDPDRGYRLITYAVWWIRAYIQAHLLASWSLVRIGTTQAQRRLFFKLTKARAELAAAGGDLSDVERHQALATALGVKQSEVSDMEVRLALRDYSLDMRLDEESGTTHMDLLVDDTDTGALVEGRLFREDRSAALDEALTILSPREREIIQLRYLSDEPMTLRDVGARFGISRERARQIEAVAKEKLRARLFARDDVMGLVEDGAVVDVHASA
jgi:RNA polymerase sigma-32 factor